MSLFCLPKKKSKKKRRKREKGSHYYLSVNLVVFHRGQQLVGQNHLVLLGKDFFGAVDVHQFGNNVSRATTLGGFCYENETHSEREVGG